MYEPDRVQEPYLPVGKTRDDVRQRLRKAVGQLQNLRRRAATAAEIADSTELKPLDIYTNIFFNLKFFIA
jgi:hypothetical protein